MYYYYMYYILWQEKGLKISNYCFLPVKSFVLFLIHNDIPENMGAEAL